MTNPKSLENSKTLLQQNRISRREFMYRAAALGVAAPLASSFLIENGFAAEPKKGGVFRMAIGGGATGDVLDPATFSETYMQNLNFGIRNCLAEINNNDELVPELAESWETSPDAITWTFKLREGIEFHNGKTFDADDAIASIQHHLGEKSQSPAKAILAPIKEIKKDGPNTIIFTLNSGNVLFPALLTDYHVPMMPLIDGELDTKSGIGTGGYTLKKFEAGVRAVLERNPNYWKSNAAHFDEIELISIIDVAARTNALITGTVDGADRLDLKTLSRLEKAPGISIKETSGSQYYGYPMMVDRAPYDNVDVRLALKYAIDREEILEKLLYGHGYIGNDNPIGKSYANYAELEQRSYDPDKAKFHLEKAGISKLEATIHAADAAFAGAVDAALLYSEQAKKAGIDLKVVRTPNDGYWSDVNRVEPWTATFWNPRPTEDMMFSTGFSDDAVWNECNWKNPRFNELLRQARVELDEAKRKEMYVEMQQLCTDDNGSIIPVFANYVFATSDKIAHGTMATSWDLDGARCLERWWYA